MIQVEVQSVMLRFLMMHLHGPEILASVTSSPKVRDPGEPRS